MKNRIKNSALNVAARITYVKHQLAEAKYEAQIAESQAKIGPYKPASIPVQIWA